MAYTKKTWVDRQSEHPTRRILTPTGTENEYDVSRSEGLILEDGDAFSAANMNDLETRVQAGICEVAPRYKARYTLDGWAAVTDETAKAGGYAYTQTAVLTPIDANAPDITADSDFLDPPRYEPPGVPATEEVLDAVLAIIDSGHTVSGANTVTTMVQELPDAEIEIIWKMRP